ncbi:hypothetical protein FDT66_04020 [Polaribacter aestuariivivens]|uniref:TerB family tellurite resistance protein n=1 Tax=Polaribacter aestuariivivens TaxID=2304626 RepID=A0A5S3N897_9FLAO|nr:hypothetical protein [Polaribacter aestuariivivens]TMM31142.1 hypothetical protein FDT66_04020 [Polaribacter aestuariivivens]
MNLNWTQKEFEAYVLLYAAHCNLIEDKNEQDYIHTIVDEKTFHKIHTEVVVDSEKENLQKIQQYLSENNLTQQDKEALLRNIKKVLFADGTVDYLEKNVYQILKKMIS